MTYKPFYRITTPGALQPKVVLITSLFVMVIVFIADLIFPASIRLHMLYIFSMAAIAIHCEEMSAVVIGLVLSTTFQFVTFFIDGIPIISLVTDALVAFSSSLLSIYLARAVRENYLEIASLATTDSLTGLHNRRSFEALVDSEIKRQKRYGGVFSLVVIDLDGFKNLNDSRGHHAGDMALQLLANVLHGHSRQPDTIARLGGDEFAILMPNTLASDCGLLCQHLSVKIASQMTAASFPVTASIGLTAFEQAPESISDALQKADDAMYAAKAGGKNCVVCL